MMSTRQTEPAFQAAKQTALEEVDALEDEIRRVSAELWNYSEIALEEERSATLLADILDDVGFALRRGVAGMPTAFVAEWGTGRPVIGVLAEYDALPEIGNAAVPRREARPDGHPHGHGCGHNLFGAGSVATAIALKRTMEKHELKGTVRLYGAPAEETLVGKVYMANAGLFGDLDAALDWHPYDKSSVMNETGQAMNNFSVEFFGQAAHSAYDPWNGRSALGAVELMNHGVNLMREHVEPTSRIHYVVTHGGQAPNIVPDYARAWYYVRENNRQKVEQNYAWVLDIAAGAARATHTRFEVTLTTGVHEMLINRPLQEAAQRNFKLVGPPAFDREDQVFAKQLQKSLELDPIGIDTRLEPLADQIEPGEGGSTDVAEVSWIAPTVSVYVASAGQGLPWHSWAIAASHGIPGAAKSAQTAARVLALTGVDLLVDPDLIARAKADFRTRTGGEPYVSPVPKDQKPPLPEER